MHRRISSQFVSKILSPFRSLYHQRTKVDSNFVTSVMVRHASAHPLANSSRSASTSDADAAEVGKAYEEAVRTLNLLQSNKETVEKIRKNRDKNKFLVVPNTRRYLERVGVSEEDLDALSVIHVSGTKGKGSTCAFTESILRHHGFKTGFFSSPHLIEVRERIRIAGEPISRKKFTGYFWDVYVPLLRASQNGGVPTQDGLNMPHYFNFLTVMAIHAFIKEKVDVAIVEVGIGGEYDCTNVLPSPVVCGVSSLGLDHTNILGTTIQSIAWHKAGIFKPSAAAFTVPQPKEAMEVLAQRAEERETRLSVVPSILTSYCSYGNESASMTDAYNVEDFVDSGSGNPMKLGIHGQAQFWNASLALHLAQAWMERRPTCDENARRDGNANTLPFRLGHEAEAWKSFGSESSTCSSVALSPAFSLDEDVAPLQPATPFPLLPPHLAGLRRTVWPGRSQVIKIHAGMTLYIDGAHTVESLQNCATWFKEETFKEKINCESFRENVNGKQFHRVLLFNLTGERNPVPLLERLIDNYFDAAIFCPNTTMTASLTGNSADQTKTAVDDSLNRKICLSNLEAWRLMQSDSNPSIVAPSIYLESIRDSLNFLDIHHEEAILSEGSEVSRPSWLKSGHHVQVLATGSLYLVGGILTLVDPDLDGTLLND